MLHMYPETEVVAKRVIMVVALVGCSLEGEPPEPQALVETAVTALGEALGQWLVAKAARVM